MAYSMSLLAFSPMQSSALNATELRAAMCPSAFPASISPSVTIRSTLDGFRPVGDKQEAWRELWEAPQEEEGLAGMPLRPRPSPFLLECSLSPGGGAALLPLPSTSWAPNKSHTPSMAEGKTEGALVPKVTPSAPYQLWTYSLRHDRTHRSYLANLPQIEFSGACS